MGLFKRKENRADTVLTVDDALLTAMLNPTNITKEIAMQIPAVSSAINLISGIVASTPIKLYKENNGKTEEVKGDIRTRLLNDDTGDTMNANEFWRAIISDFYLGKGGYAYINKEKGQFKSLHYVDETYITILKNIDPIFKTYDISVNGTPYKPYEFFKILRNSKDGASGTGIITENSRILELAYQSLLFEINLVKKGGNKKGFLNSEKQLADTAMEKLKAAFKNLYSNNDESVVILNNGIKFQESSNTALEMQLNENKKSNSEGIGNLFRISLNILSGKATDEEMSSFTKIVIIPLLNIITCALNVDFLLEREKESYYFAFDTKELLKGGLLERYQAYEIAVKNGLKSRNEIRYQEDEEAVDGLDFYSLSLADVIYDPITKTFFTPNTKQITGTSGVANTSAINAKANETV
jgi:HK97 family phage portal protein